MENEQILNGQMWVHLEGDYTAEQLERFASILRENERKLAKLNGDKSSN